MKKNHIAVIGGDERNLYVAHLLEQAGHQVISYGLSDYSTSFTSTLRETMEFANIIIGGIPFFHEDTICSKIKLSDLTKIIFLNNLQKNQIFFAGMLSENFMEECRKRGVACYDFMKEETLMQKNAIATAEGAILEALKNQSSNLHKSNCLVLGYGRCGGVLAEKLKGLSANVTICSKSKEELARGESYGMNVLFLENLDQEIRKYEYIFNTIPAVILKENILKKIEKTSIVIDLASGVGGIDYLSAEKQKIRAFHCLGLPGKYAAQTSALYMVEYVKFQMESRGIEE